MIQASDSSIPDTLEEIHNVSKGPFSIARHYGGCRINGKEWFYNPITDVLIRADVLKKRNTKEPQPEPEQMKLL